MNELGRPTLGKRSVHLDFHTSPLIQPIAAEFDAEEFAERFQRMRVDSVTVFAKCHHGQLYYDTDRPERHPGLAPGVDLLREQIEALRSKSIRAPIYLSVMFDEFAARHHPDWVALDSDSHPMRVNVDGALGWRILDMASPYRDYLADQITDVLDHFADADGFFFDICFDRVSFSDHFRRNARSLGFDPDQADSLAPAARAISHEYMARFRDLVASPDTPGAAARSVFFNSRPRLRAQDELEYATHDEIEALPTGGWGYTYAPYVARNVLAFQPRAQAMTGRFFGSWGDSASLHPAAALRYESVQMLALGVDVIIGDSLPPSGRSHDAVTELMGDTFAYVESVQRITDGLHRVVEVAVIKPTSAAGTNVHVVDSPTDGSLGALRVLTALGIGFEFVNSDAELSRYAAVIVLAGVELDAPLRRRLSERARDGAGIFLSGIPETLDLEWAQSVPGIRVVEQNSFLREFVRPVSATTSMPDFELVTPGRIRRVTAAQGTTVLATVTEPYFDRTESDFSGHEYTPAGHPTSFPALLVHRRVATALFPLFEAYGATGTPQLAQLATAALRLILPRPALRIDGPAHLEASLQSDGTTSVAHLISYSPSRRSRSAIETVLDPIPVLDLRVAVRHDGVPRTVRQQPEGVDLPFAVSDGYIETVVTFTEGHTMVVIESD